MALRLGHGAGLAADHLPLSPLGPGDWSPPSSSAMPLDGEKQRSRTDLIEFAAAIRVASSRVDPVSITASSKTSLADLRKKDFAE